jgi:hypothetical protein
MEEPRYLRPRALEALISKDRERMGIAVGQVLEYYRLYDRRVNDTQGIQIALLNLARSDKSPRRPYNHRWWTTMRIMKRNLVQWMANGNVPPDDSQQDGGRGALMPWVPEVDVLYALRFLDLRTSGIPRSLRDILNEVNLLFLIDPEQPVPEFWRSARLNDPVWRRRHMQQESKSSVTCSISDAELDEIIKDIQAILGAEGSSSSTVVWQPPQWNRERDLPRDAWRIIQSASQTQPSASFMPSTVQSGSGQRAQGRSQPPQHGASRPPNVRPGAGVQDQGRSQPQPGASDSPMVQPGRDVDGQNSSRPQPGGQHPSPAQSKPGMQDEIPAYQEWDPVLSWLNAQESTTNSEGRPSGNRLSSRRLFQPLRQQVEGLQAHLRPDEDAEQHYQTLKDKMGEIERRHDEVIDYFSGKVGHLEGTISLLAWDNKKLQRQLAENETSGQGQAQTYQPSNIITAAEPQTEEPNRRARSLTPFSWSSGYGGVTPPSSETSSSEHEELPTHATVGLTRSRLRQHDMQMSE